MMDQVHTVHAHTHTLSEDQQQLPDLLQPKFTFRKGNASQLGNKRLPSEKVHHFPSTLFFFFFPAQPPAPLKA